MKTRARYLCAMLLGAAMLTAASNAQLPRQTAAATPHRGATSVGFTTGKLGNGVSITGRYSYGVLLLMGAGRFTWKEINVPYNASLDFEAHQDYSLMAGTHVRIGAFSMQAAAGPCLATGKTLGSFRAVRIRTESISYLSLVGPKQITFKHREDLYNFDTYQSFGFAGHAGVALRVGKEVMLGCEVHAVRHDGDTDIGFELAVIMGTI